MILGPVHLLTFCLRLTLTQVGYLVAQSVILPMSAIDHQNER